MTFARARIAIVAMVAIAVGLGACGGEGVKTQSRSQAQGSPSNHSPSPAGQTFNINPEPGVRASGTVTVFAGPTSTTIEVKISGLAPTSNHVSHIHTSSCQSHGPIKFALNQVIADGQGEADTRTFLNEKFPGSAGRWYVVVHAGPDMQGTSANYLLCGNLF